ncbi:alpha-amylase [Dysgonomonas sp. 216]|uniref:alpha-amylase family glycosyl hydrolase n=1 Tax=Dysgonomonas sp. 216 TaxID=2302934 RepID=UPI0013D42A6B|nr:alpha-amylase family glycosyl hydrolase [Dysgonomonas sp. 216]NDW17461.1 alpha-amylase [Dysgonomonas sp. 216]
MSMKSKLFIYQIFPRLFGNTKSVNKENGSLEENGVGKFSSISSKALSEIKKMGFTHIWFTGIIEHASKTDYTRYGIQKDNPEVVKGNAGSPYAIRDYYDVCPDLADDVANRMFEFEELIARTHRAGMKVIIDFVPNHVARQYHSDAKPRKIKDLGCEDDNTQGFAPDNNFYYLPGQNLELQFETSQGENAYIEYPAKVTGNDKFDNKPTLDDWYETVKLNYGVNYWDNRAKFFTAEPDTWHKMKEILLYWASKGVDGFRCDMAEMVPVEFWNWVINEVKSKYKSIVFVAEVYNPAEYGSYTYTGKFDYLYDKVGLYDAIKSITCGERPASDITFCWQKLEELQPRMLNFMENHDEQRIASDFFAGNAFKAIPGMIVSVTMNTNPVLIYSGQELGERGMDKEGFSGVDGRTSIYDYWSVDSLRKWYNNGNFGNEQLSPEQIELRKFYIKLLTLSNDESAIYKGNFFDLMYANYENPRFDPTKQFTYLRAYKKELILIVVNFGDKDADVTINIPDLAFDYLKIKGGDYVSAKDLLGGRSISLKKGLGSKFDAKLSAFSGKIIKFSTK